ncbi:alkaline-phosphatase-like protein [Aspergillus avenaceus]|uniref:Arylsulfatase n=1 Tax=Aspergillus avenaceus TaxID=36643 RepID=A0A5N6U718_ASPAV|nr:alkaline-phosphatase-like protein [Aspergillus avenaceus]
MKGLAQSLLALSILSSSVLAFDRPALVLQDGSATVGDIHRTQGPRPNIVFILVDDQDLQLGSLSYTPHINRYIRDQGIFYKNHFVTTALCCPSRVSLWTGKQAHNTNVTEIYPPYGGYPKFVTEGHNDNWLPLWLQDAGYNTYYTGKLFNSHTVDNYHSPFVRGFNSSDFALDPYTYQYLHPVYQRDQDDPVDYAGRHTIDVIRQKALGYLDDAIAESEDRPFFLTIAPIAPHSNFEMANDSDVTTFRFSAPIPLDRHRGWFPNAKVPRTANFNPDSPSGVNWIRTLPQQDQASIDSNDEFYRARLRALQGVDELVEDVIHALDSAAVLENTYIFYTSDNGYHIGQHRLHPGKECGFEEDIRVPMFIRGPGIPSGEEVEAPTTHIDLAPTIFEIAGIPLRDEFDGTAVPFEPGQDGRKEHVHVEYWGKAGFEGETSRMPNGGPVAFRNNTYKALRVLGDGYNLYYSVWCTNEHELYDLATDPHELTNLHPSANSTAEQLLGFPIEKVISRLDALLLVLKSCQGISCTKPWDVLHPAGDVQTLRDALADSFDVFYQSQVRVEYGWCEEGYILEAEGAQVPAVYQGTRWSDWW